MAAQELRWLTYLLTDLGEPPRSSPVLYVDNKAMLALCREQRLEHRTKHIALRYFLARELQQRGQLRLAYVASKANTADVFTKALAPSCSPLLYLTGLMTPCSPPLCLWGRPAAEPPELPEPPEPPASSEPPGPPSCPADVLRPYLLRLGRAVDFEVWVDDLQLFLQCDRADGLSLFDLTSGASPAPPATADNTVRSQWATRDAAAHLAVRRHLPTTERVHFSQYKSAQTLYDAVVARYSSPATAALSRLFLTYLFPELAAFPTVADLITHLRISDTRYRAALPAEFCAKNPPPIYLTLYYVVTRLPDSLRVVRDHFLSVCPTTLTVDLIEERLLAAEQSIVAVGASRGDPRTPIFEGCSPMHHLSLHLSPPQEPSEIPRWGDLSRAGVAIFDLDYDAILAAMYALSTSDEGDYYLCVPPDPGIEAATLGAGEAAALGASASATPGAGESALSGTASAQVLHTFTLDSGASRSFFQDHTTLTPLSRPVTVSLADPSGGPVLASFSTVLPCPAAPSGSLSGLYLPSFSTNLVSGADLQDQGVDQFTPASQRVTNCTCARTGRHLATFSRRPGSSLYTLSTESPPLSASGQVAASSQVFAAASGSTPESAPCSCRLLSHQTLLWHHRLGHPSLPRLRGMASCVLVSGLPRSLPPLPPGPAPTCVPCVDGRQRAAPHSSDRGSTADSSHGRVGPSPRPWPGSRAKGEATEVLIDWIRAARLRLRESFGSDFPVLRLHSDRGGEFSSARLGAFCRAQGIRQTFTLPASPQQNGIAERRIGMVMDVARTSMIHAAAPHFLWPFAVQYAAHQLNLQPRVSLPETSPTLLWTGKVGDASAFRVWGSRAFVRDLSADKLSPRATPCVFLGFPPDAPGWQFYHPTSRRVLSSQDFTLDESVPYYRLFPYRTAPLPPPPLFLAPGPPPVDPLPPQGPAPSGVSQVDALEPVEVAIDSGAATGAEPAGAGSGGAGSGGAETEGADSGGAETEGAEPGGVEPEGAEPGGSEPGGAEPGGAETGGAEPWGAEPGGTQPGGAEPGGAGPARVATCGASSRREVLSPQELREWFARRWGRAAGAGGTTAATGSGGTCPGGAGAAGPGGTAEDAGVGPTGVSVGASGGAGAAGTAGTAAAGATGVGAAGGVGAGETADAGPFGGAGAGAVGAGGAAGAGAAAERTGAVPTGSGECPQPVQSQSPLQPVSPLPAPSPYTGPTRGLAERRAPASRPASPARPACTSPRTSRPRPPAVPGTHQMALRPSNAPLRVPLPSPPASFLPSLADPESDSLRAASPTVARFLATVVTDPSLASTAASALVAELVDFAAHCRLDYAAGLVVESASVCPPSVGGECALGTDGLEDRQEEFQCFAAALPHLVSTLHSSFQLLESLIAAASSPAFSSQSLLPSGRPDQFDTWLDDLQLYLLSDSKDSVSLFDHVSGAATAPPATADSATRSQWLSRDAAARLAIRNHLPLAKCTHFGQHRTAQALYETVVARYSSPATAALGRLLLPYLFPELSAVATVKDLVSHLCASDARYCAATLVEDHFLSLDPTSLTVDLLEQHLLAAETSAVAVGAARGTPRPPFFEGCFPSPLAPSYASAAAADVSVPEDVGAASASAKRRSSKGKGGRGGGGGSGGGGGGSGSSGGGSSGGGGGGGTGGGSGGSGGGGGGSGGSGGSGGGGIGGGGTGARRVGSGGGRRRQQQRRSKTQSPQQLREWFLQRGASKGSGSCPYVIRMGDRAGQICGQLHTQHRCFSRLNNDWRAEFADDAELPCTTLTPLLAPVPVRLADPSGGPVVARSSTILPCPAVPSGSLSGLHLPSFSTNLVSASGQVAASCSCRLLSHQTLLWHHRLGHPSLPHLHGMHSRLLVSGLPRSLPPLLPSPSPPCLPCVEGRQRTAPHSSFPPTTAPLQTLHMDVWGPAHVSGQGSERYFLLVVDDYTRYTTVFPLRNKGEVSDVLIPWICAVRLQLRERFGQDLPVLRLHCDRGGEFSSDLLREFCCGEFYHSTSRRVFPFQDVMFDEPVPFYPLFPYRSAPPPPLPLFLAPGPPPVDPLSPQGPAPSGVSQKDPLPGTAPVQVAVGLGAAPGAASGGAGPGGEEPGGAEPAGVETRGVESGGAEPEGAESGGAEPRGAASSSGPAGASPRLSPQRLREWFARCPRLRSGATIAGDAGAGGAGVTAGGGGAGAAGTGPGGAHTRGTGAAGAGGVEGAGAGDPTEPGATGAGGSVARARGAGVEGAGVFYPRAGGAGDTVWPRPYFVPLLQQPASPLPAPSPYTEQLGGLTERRESTSRPVLPVRTARRVPRSCPPPVPGTHAMALRPSFVPLRVPLPASPESSLPEVLDPAADRDHAASLTASRLLATAVTDPSFESAAASALAAELLEFAAACRLDYATTLVSESESASPPSVGGQCALVTDVLEDRQEDFECLATAVPRLASMLLVPEGDPDAPDIPTPRSYAEAITDEANIVDGMWIFRVKPSPGSPPAFKARYVARGFSQQQGVNYFQTFSPTPKMTTLRVLLHVAAQHDCELHSLDFSTAFLQGSLHKEIWLRRLPGFTGSFPTGTQWSLLRPVYGLRQAPREWHDTLRTTLAALGFTPSTADPSLFLRTDTSLPLFYVLVYVDDLVFATGDTEALTLVKSELQKRNTCTDLGELHSYLALQITLDRARRTITLTQSHMVHQVLQRFGFQFFLPQPTPVSTGHSLSVPPSDKSVEPSGPYLKLVGCLMYLMTCTRPDLAYPLSLLARYVAPVRQAWDSCLEDEVQFSSCEAEIYAGAMAAQELRWLTYLLTDLGEQPCSPPVLYQRGQLRLAYVATRANTSDILTKALPPGDHQRFSTVLGLGLPSYGSSFCLLSQHGFRAGTLLACGPTCFRCYSICRMPRGVRLIFHPAARPFAAPLPPLAAPSLPAAALSPPSTAPSPPAAAPSQPAAAPSPPAAAPSLSAAAPSPPAATPSPPAAAPSPPAAAPSPPSAAPSPPSRCPFAAPRCPVVAPWGPRAVPLAVPRAPSPSHPFKGLGVRGVGVAVVGVAGEWRPLLLLLLRLPLLQLLLRGVDVWEPGV
ncbi:unnamed protein product [Closterium sp. NIES-53]